MEDPGEIESSRVIEASEAAVDDEDSSTGRAIDAGEGYGAPGSRPASHCAPVATPSFRRATTTGQNTPRPNDVSIYSSSQTESDLFEKVLVSYLLRHFKQGPGQW